MDYLMDADAERRLGAATVATPMAVTRRSLERAAMQLGLTIEGDRALRGVGPRGIAVRVSYQGSGTQRRGRADRDVGTIVNAYIDPALQLGLEIVPRRDGEASEPAASGSSSPSPLDRLFAIRAIDGAHAHELLAGEVGALLDDLENSLAFVTDERVVLRSASHLVSPESLGGMLGAATAMAAHLAAARRRTARPGWQRALEAGWSVVAASRRLALDMDRLEMLGASGAMFAGVRAELSALQIRTRVVGWFPAPLGVALRLRRQRAGDRLASFLGSQDVRIGDRTFDDAFVVRGSSAERVRSLITPGVARSLMALVGRGLEVEVDDAWVSASTPGLVVDAAHVCAMLDGVIAAGMAMTGHVLDGPAA